MSKQIVRLLEIMALLRDPEKGCDWDLAQDSAAIAPYTIEEAYEVADAIARYDMAALREELGDLLFQVVFHARIAEEAGQFSFDDVARTIADKMIERHPHIFSRDGIDPRTPSAGTMTEDRWESIKEQERSAKGASSQMDGVARALPALMRAQKLQKRAARIGFDWPDPSAPRAKIDEELEELSHATSEAEKIEEAGDVLFATVNYLRKLGIDAEAALRDANDKFERRFRAMENMGGKAFRNLDLDEMEERWQAVKREEASHRDSRGQR